MIQSIILEYFKTYSNQTFIFHPGINLFVGSSNNGKSQIFRAFYWVINNRPMGRSVISYWNRDNKGDPIHPTKVIIQADNREVIRLREFGCNCYLFNDKTFEALRGNVPDEILSFLNMTDINIQRQKEQPFLISFTPGEIAKYLNAIIKLDVIDDCLTNVKQKKTKCENALKIESSEIEELQIELNSLNWIEDAEMFLEKVESINRDRVEKEEFLSRLSESVNSYLELREKAEQFIGIESAGRLVIDIRKIESELIEKRNHYKLLSDLIEKYNLLNKKIGESICVCEVECIISDIQQNNTVMENVKAVESTIIKLIGSYEIVKNQLFLIEKRLIELNNELPEICPMCNGTGKIRGVNK